jgi:hypothetical protein
VHNINLIALLIRDTKGSSKLIIFAIVLFVVLVLRRHVYASIF